MAATTRALVSRIDVAIFSDEDGLMHVVDTDAGRPDPIGSVWVLRYQTDDDDPYARVRITGVIEFTPHSYELTLTPMNGHAAVKSAEFESFMQTYRREDAVDERIDALKAKLGVLG